MDWNEFIKNFKRTKTFKGTWLDRPGECYSYLLAKKRLGLRIVVHTWIDTNEVEIRLLDGDGRTINFKEYKRIILQKPTDKQIKHAVLELYIYSKGGENSEN